MLRAASQKFSSSIGTTLRQEYDANEIQVAAAERSFAKLHITPAVFEEFGPHVLREPDDAWLDDGAGSLDYRKKGA